MSAPLLAWSGLRIDSAEPSSLSGMPLFDGDGAFSAASTGASRLLVLGAPRAIFLAVAGELEVVRGHLSIVGKSPAEARRDGTLAVVRFDVPLPPAWRALRYVTWSARLAGRPSSEAEEAAHRALAELSIDADAKLGSLDEAAKQRVQVATALASGAGVVAIDDPFAARTDASATAFEEVLLTALAAHGRAWIAFAARVPLASRFAREADHTVVVARAEVAAEGTAASIAALARAYVLRLVARGAGEHEDAETAKAASSVAKSAFAAFARAAADCGIELTTRGDATVVVLPQTLGTRALFPLAAAADLAIVELRPLAGPLS